MFGSSSVVEQLAVNQWAVGSNPTCRANKKWTSNRCPNDKLANTQTIHNSKMKGKKAQKTRPIWWLVILLKCSFSKLVKKKDKKPNKINALRWLTDFGSGSKIYTYIHKMIGEQNNV